MTKIEELTKKFLAARLAEKRLERMIADGEAMAKQASSERQGACNISMGLEKELLDALYKESLRK